jgi:PAS domain S-box-containing protein
MPEYTRIREDIRRAIEAIPQQIWSGRVDGSIDYCNHHWRVYAGLELEDAQGEGWQHILHPSDKGRVLNAWRESVNTGTPFEQEGRLRAADGTYRCFVCRAVPLKDGDGNIERWYGTNTEIGYCKRADENRKLITERQNSVGLINHHIRNALQIISSAAYIWPENHEFADVIKGAFTRIDWVLREILPGLMTTCDADGRDQSSQIEEALSTISRRLIQAQEEERIRIARELHDDIGQRLVLMALELAQLQQRSSVSLPELLRHILQVQRDIEILTTDVQCISHELHCSRADYLGLIAAMRSWCREFGEKQKLKISFESHDVPNVLPSAVSACLYRVLQEAVHNAAKHGGVKDVDVKLGANSQEIYLTVNNLGFDAETAMKGQELSLCSMRERLAMVNGYFSIDTLPKRGTTIQARVPFTSTVQSALAG